MTDGNLEVAEGAIVRESIRADGELRIGPNSVVEGSAISASGAFVGASARIGGTLLVAGAVRWGDAASAQRAAIRGPLVTSGGTKRATSITALRGIHPAGRSPSEGAKA